MAGGGLALAVTAFASTQPWVGYAGSSWVGFLTETLGAARWGLVSIGLVMVLGALAVAVLARERTAGPTG